jgi:transcriptional regulator with XRE-family HTH domain
LPYLIGMERKIGVFVHETRKAAGLSLRGAAKLLNCNFSLVSRIESGDRQPSVEFLWGLAQVAPVDPVTFHRATGLLHPSIADLLTGDDKLLAAAGELTEAVQAGKVDRTAVVKGLKALAAGR